MSRKFWLVQRMHYAPGKVSNPFGYGKVGDYQLDDMGSAEFEWGAIPESVKRLEQASKERKLVTRQHEYQGHTITFLYVKDNGDPFNDWLDWANGKDAVRKFFSKEPPYDFERLMKGEERTSFTSDVWWALDEDVMWSLDKEHIERILAS